MTSAADAPQPPELSELAERLGILPGYVDQLGRYQRCPAETKRALLAAMGIESADIPGRLALLRAERAARRMPGWLVCTPGTPPALPLPGAAPWELCLEDGESIEGRGPLPGLPMGRHRLERGREACWLIVAPPRLPLPRRGWGVSVPLAGLRCDAEGGIGTYGDLMRAGVPMAARGASFLGINPVHAGFPQDPSALSPYSPSHRRRLSTLYVDTGEAGAPRDGPFLDPARQIEAQTARVARAFECFEAEASDAERAAFEAWVAGEGPGLQDFSCHQALSLRHGPYWTRWPAALQAGPAAATAPPGEKRPHLWAQWEAHRQLAAAASALEAAGMRHGLYLDLAVGTAQAGAETWADPALFARGVSLGAPPDAFSPEPQRWELAPFEPNALAARGFAPLAETLRAQFRYARLLRVDHILGFDRAFWVPQDRGLPGAYVAMPRAAMLAVLRLEAARAGASVVGEDLGNIPAGLQSALAGSGILGTRLLQFEFARNGAARPAADYPEAALAAFGTHDLPTAAGWGNGHDIALHHGLGRIDAAARDRALEARRGQAEALAREAGGSAPPALHRHLARTRCRLALVQIEDALGLEAQANLPGTRDEYPNWRRRLPCPAPALAETPGFAAAAAAMKEEGRTP